MKKLIGIGSLSLGLLLAGGNAFGQQQCRPSYGYCSGLVPRAYLNSPLPGASSSNDCPPGTSQAPIGVCDATWRRVDGTNVYVTAGIGYIQPGQQYIVRAPPVNAQPPGLVSFPAGYGQLRRQVRLDRVNIVTLDQNARADVARQALVNDQQAGLNGVLISNDFELLRRNAATNTHVNNVEWRVGDLREEFRVRFYSPIRYTWQAGGSPTLGLAGVGVGITRWGQGSILGIDANVAFHGVEMQPLAPGPTPLFGASAGIHAVVGRGGLQGLLGATGGMAFRFGDAGPKEVTGGTAFDLGLGGGVRGEMPFYPTLRPQGARFYGQFQAHFGLGGSNALVAGQDPLHLGFALSLEGALGVAL